MDKQSQQPATSGQAPNPQPAVLLTQTVTDVSQQGKPKLDLSDSEANDLLMLSNLQAGQQPKPKLPLKLVIVALGAITLVIVVSFLLGAFKPGGESKSSNPAGLGLPNQSDASSGSNVSKQINQDVKTCSNPLNAITVC